MAHGLIWFPLLILISWLAWSGGNEYRKLEAYRLWAGQFDKAKYDIYAVLGYKEKQITWGKPTPTGPVNLESFSLKSVNSIRLLVNEQEVDLSSLPSEGKPLLEFISGDELASIKIPFTDISLAAQWAKFLEQELHN